MLGKKLSIYKTATAPLCRRYVCECAWGASAAAATPQRAAAYAQRAKQAWQVHQRQDQLFAPPPPAHEVDLVLPRLLRGRRRVPSAEAGASRPDRLASSCALPA